LGLFTKLNILKEIIQVQNDTLINIFSYVKGINSFPNENIAYETML